MKYLKKIILLFLFIQSILFSEEVLNPEYQTLIKPFITAVKNNNTSAICKMIRYPLKREYPIPSIMNEEEMLMRFNEVFDDKLKEEILKSSIESDWDDVGWRGIMLNRGTLWIDYNGSIHAINYQSENEKKFKEKLIKNEKNNVHTSLQKFELPCLVCVTKKFKIRIDDLGDYNYRYAVWPKEKEQNEQPDLILKNGKWVPDGSGGNHYYEFINNKYKYRIYVFVIGSDETPPGILEVYKSDKLILEQNIENFIK